MEAFDEEHRAMLDPFNEQYSFWDLPYDGFDSSLKDPGGALAPPSRDVSHETRSASQTDILSGSPPSLQYSSSFSNPSLSSPPSLPTPAPLAGFEPFRTTPSKSIPLSSVWEPSNGLAGKQTPSAQKTAQHINPARNSRAFDNLPYMSCFQDLDARFAILPERLPQPVGNFSQEGSETQCLLQQPLNHRVNGVHCVKQMNGVLSNKFGAQAFAPRSFNRNIDSPDHSAFDQWQNALYSSDHTSPPSKSLNSMAGTFGQTNNSMNKYPPIPNTMSSIDQVPHGLLQWQDQFGDQQSSVMMSRQIDGNIFVGFDPYAPTYNNGLATITDPLVDPNILPQYPAPVATSYVKPSPNEDVLTAFSSTPSVANDESSRRDHSRDDELITLRNQGYTYREIKARFGFTEAESTLRGRYRTIIKAKEDRVRKPEWKSEDVQLLFDTVQTQTQETGNVAASAYQYTLDGLPILTDEDNLKKISWKKVAEVMADQGAYHYGNATVKKKYIEFRNMKLCGIQSADQVDDSTYGPGPAFGVGGGAAVDMSAYQAVDTGYGYTEPYDQLT